MVGQVHLTSFFESGKLDKDLWTVNSCAVYQPRGYELPKVAWTDIRVEGRWTRPRNFLEAADPAEAYWTAMAALYESRLEAAKAWAEDAPTYVALCCWCPFDRAAKRQIEEFGSYICHTGPLAEFIATHLCPITFDVSRCEQLYGRDRPAFSEQEARWYDAF